MVPPEWLPCCADVRRPLCAAVLGCLRGIPSLQHAQGALLAPRAAAQGGRGERTAWHRHQGACISVPVLQVDHPFACDRRHPLLLGVGRRHLHLRSVPQGCPNAAGAGAHRNPAPGIPVASSGGRAAPGSTLAGGTPAGGPLLFLLYPSGGHRGRCCRGSG